MPHFYFDIKDNGGPVRDHVGQILQDRDAVQREAVRALREMARAAMLDGTHREFVANVRDETGRVIYSAVLNLHGRWLD